MPNYHLSFKKGKDEFKHIPENLLKLDRIDKFTTMFESEQKLKEFLARKYVPISLLNNEDFKYKIVISYKNNGKEKYLHVPFGIAYKEDLKFLDEYYLKSYMQSQKLNPNFISKLYNKFIKYYGVSEILNTLNNHINMYINNNFSQFMGGKKELEDVIIKDIDKVFENIIFNYRKNKISLIYEKVFSYLQFHCLAMFCANYEKEKKLKKEKNCTELKDDNNFQIDDDKELNIDEYILDDFGKYNDDFIELSENIYHPDSKRKN